ncbi:hypothetical protein GCM10011581_45360 [Saccharopolyspora subtropica]|uniref:ESAT-6-like protein n=1 Tax=Saccharopolyspora thermophila TaxID=89367 RepID=A0A917KAF9_9PSEU|nr:WXG100 family type VII secretion target [Saccharopolyspora subtropica]GGJ03145.1 hypothetical protein GCM10011581_45360 [Saccharopolyspora subtropica]
MAQQVQTSTPGMQHAAQRFAETVSDFNQQLQKVNTTMSSLQASWTGDASRDFNTAMDNWERSFQVIINKLIEIMDTMGVNTKAYVNAEENASGTAKYFAQALPPLPGV